MWVFAWDLKIKHLMHWNAINFFTPSFSKHWHLLCTWHLLGTGCRDLTQHSSVLNLHNPTVSSCVSILEPGKTTDVSFVHCRKQM